MWPSKNPDDYLGKGSPRQPTLPPGVQLPVQAGGMVVGGLIGLAAGGGLWLPAAAFGGRCSC